MITLTEDHRYVNEVGREYPGVTSVIRTAGLMGWMPDDDWYLDRGHAVHSACELWDKGTLDEDALDPQIRPYLDAWRAYRRDTGYHAENVEEIEQLVCNPVVGYCGKIDRPGLDIKTGAPTKWHILQAAAYWHALKTRGEWHSVYLRDDGTYKLVIYRASELQAAFKVFCAALIVTTWAKENGIHG